MAGSGPLFLLDGNSLIFRAFFALPTDLATTGGQVTNAVLGFSSIFVNLLRDHDPSGVAVAFDRPEPTFRDEMVADYKGNRPETPDLDARGGPGDHRRSAHTLNLEVSGPRRAPAPAR